MADIGATLREARMRARIDITDMEVRTKIRAKYLRALENEEWDLLPGPTYGRSFLRTYAEALGLDAKMLVEEYKLRHDPMETAELHPIRRPSAREREQRRRNRQRRGIPRGALIGVLLAAIIAALFGLGKLFPSDEDPDEAAPVATLPTETNGSSPSGSPAKKKSSTKKKKKKAASRVVRLQVVPTGEVSVCLVDAGGKVLIGNEILQEGSPSRTYRSKRFRIVLGNNSARLRINGKARSVPASSDVIAYSITRAGRKDLPAGSRPDCTG